MSIVLANAAVVVNNEPVAIVPNSVTFTEGLGEQTMRASSSGGGAVDQVYAEDVTTNFSKVKFELYNDIDSIELARSWKANRNRNTVSISGKTPDGKTISRTFQSAAILDDYEVELGSDTTFSLDFKSKPAV